MKRPMEGELAIESFFLNKTRMGALLVRFI